MMKAAILSAMFLSLLVVPALAEEDAAAGEKVFKKCMACHTADAATNKTGPYLKGVVGRPVASVEGYKYSSDLAALGAGGSVWDEEFLEKYLENPKAVAPKGKMAFPGLKKEDERKAVVAYLKTKM